MARQTKLKKDIRFDDRFERLEPVIDADFETIKAPPKLETTAPISKFVSRFEKEKATAANDQIGMTVFGKKPVKLMRDDSVAFYGFSALLVLFSFWISGGHSLIRQVDTQVDTTVTAGITPAKNTTEIAEAAWRVVTIDGRSALHIEGIVRNPAQFAVHTKPVTVTVKQSDGATKRYLLGQKGWTLGPGQEVVVSGRLDIVSAGIASVVISATD